MDARECQARNGDSLETTLLMSVLSGCQLERKWAHEVFFVLFFLDRGFNVNNNVVCFYAICV